MKQKAKRIRTIYDDSLPRIFLWSGFTVFVILLIACVIIGAVIFFSHYNLDEGRKIILACLALAVPGSYGLPLISLIKVWNQERAGNLLERPDGSGTSRMGTGLVSVL